MVKAWCCWCENDMTDSPSGYLWIHHDCFHDIMGYGDDVEDIKKILEGKHPRNRFEKEKSQTKIDIILELIYEMEDWRQKWIRKDKAMREMGIIKYKRRTEVIGK